MILDKEEHRAALLELINKSAFPGVAARQVVELQDALIMATVTRRNESAAELDIEDHTGPRDVDVDRQ